MARLGEARLGLMRGSGVGEDDFPHARAKLFLTWQLRRGKVRHGFVGQGKAWQFCRGKAWPGKARSGEARQSWLGLARHGLARQG